MPKSRKAKAKHKDFQKVKLKVGKRLPKGLNETKATFKSSNIVLKEQFKSDSTEPTTKRKLDINEILIHCQHFSAGIKHDALQRMKELITTNPAILNSFLPGILEKLCELFMDKDAVVRSTVQKLLKIVFQKVSTSQISPFFPVVSAHLCCAMTNIQDEIRLDSLGVLDLCLENYPRLVISNTSQLLPNFIEQISQQSHSKKDKIGKERTLLINPNSKLSSQKWRIQVLERLFKFLKALLDSQGSIMTSSQESRDGVVNMDIGKNRITGCSVLGSLAPRHFTFSPSFRSGGIASCGGGSELLSDPEKFKSYFQTLVPLLMQCWIEVGPAQMNAGSKAGNVLSYDALVTLNSVMGVLQFLIQIVHQHIEENEHLSLSWIQATYLDDFVHYFMTYFPYSVHSGRGKRDRKSKDKEVSVNSINLAVCDVMSYFLDAPGVSKTKWFGWIVTHLSEQLTSEVKIPPSDLSCIIRILDKAVKLSSQEKVISDILESACDLYQRKHPASSDAQAMLFFFSKLVLQGKNKEYIMSLPSIIWWLAVLPEHAALVKGSNEKASLEIYRVMNLAGAQNRSAFLSSLQQNLNELIDPDYIKKIPPSIQTKLIELLYWAPEINRHHVIQLAHSCHGGGFTAGNVIYLIQVLQMRVDKADAHSQRQVSPGDFISFLLSAMVGYSKDELDQLSSASKPSRCTILSGDQDRWKFTHRLSSHARLALKQLMNEADTWNVLGPFMEQILTNWPCLPFNVWMGAMEILSDFYPTDTKCHSAAAIRLIAEWSLAFILQTANKEIKFEDEDLKEAQVYWNQQPKHKQPLQIVAEICSDFLSRVSGCFTEMVGLIKEKVVSQDGSLKAVRDYVTALTWLMKCVDSAIGKDALPMLLDLQNTIKSTFADADFCQWFGLFKIELKNWEIKNKSVKKKGN